MSTKKTVTLLYSQHEAMEKEIQTLKEKLSKQERDVPILKFTSTESYNGSLGYLNHQHTKTYTLTQHEEASLKLKEYFEQEYNKLEELNSDRDEVREETEHLVGLKEKLISELEDKQDELKDLETKISDKKVSSFIIKGFFLVAYSVLLLSI